MNFFGELSCHLKRTLLLRLVHRDVFVVCGATLHSIPTSIYLLRSRRKARVPRSGPLQAANYVLYMVPLHLYNSPVRLPFLAIS